MNIKLIKSEIEKLSLILSSWESEEQISPIERDIVLDKLKKLYDLVRFDITPTETTPTSTPTPATEAEESEEKDVEVELIFAEDEFPEEEFVEEEEDETVSVSDFIAATVASAIADAADAKTTEDAEPELEVEVIYDEEQSEDATEEVEEPMQEPIPAIESIVATEEIAEEAATEEVTPAEPEPTPEPVQEPEPEPTQKPEPTPAPVETPQPERQMNSLFNMEEVRRPRSKHQRMMSIYSDNEQQQQEKVVDISKIFDVDIDEPIVEEPTPAPKPAPAPEPKPAAIPVAKPAPTVEEKPTTLADSIPALQTLADTLMAHTPLAEEINHARMRSLRDGIGLNDKFLMIRDLFDGDGEAYEEAINALDELETMDDCMIHIIENYAWNPDSEGSKFIMQLLERKLS